MTKTSRGERFYGGYYEEGNIYSLESYPYKRVRIDWTSTTPNKTDVKLEINF